MDPQGEGHWAIHIIIQVEGILMLSEGQVNQL